MRFNEESLQSDCIVDIPVLKTHAQTVVSLGIKNLKGLIDIASRKKCHSADPEKDLHYMVSKLADPMPPMLTIIDGIYSNERGPGIDGRMRRSDIVVASWDVLSADVVGAKLLGYEPSEVPHLVHAAKARGGPYDLSDIDVKGVPVEDLASFHEHTFPYNEAGTLPAPMENKGIKGLSYRKYDLTMCTYCSFLNGLILTAIAAAWDGRPWDDVEVLTGKVMEPTPGMKKTVLIGKCICRANKDHPDIQEAIAVKGCPPSVEEVISALHQAGIEVNPAVFENRDKAPAFFMRRYEGKPEFEESFFRVL